MSLFWRIFATNAVVLGTATALLLWAAPVTASVPVLLTEAIILVSGLVVMLIATRPCCGRSQCSLWVWTAPPRAWPLPAGARRQPTGNALAGADPATAGAVWKLTESGRQLLIFS
ncbi:hypothetical protein QF027_008015 [Streptomyces canus]|nr:hypothetical protein [Streptomyces canus]